MDLNILKEFQYIAKMAHENAKNKGFWDGEIKQGIRRNDGEMLSLIHAEIHELYEALLDSERLSTKIYNSKQCQDIYEYEEELADIIIRLADMVLSHHWPIWDYFEFGTENLFYNKTLEQLHNLEDVPISSHQRDFLRANIICNFFHSCLGQITEALREPQQAIELICIKFASMVRMIAYLETQYGFRVNQAIGLKLEYNKQRPYMHNKQF
ncbi:hypothetical protein [Candidatus Albibeggiatoa sp. nov. BB20]|uniref:hypothetical protein n=1 Tax=Candidatus Albibeggiatoa sp. nov. BB20 TaxID=3162723 RepID=UPI0033656A03